MRQTALLKTEHIRTRTHIEIHSFSKLASIPFRVTDGAGAYLSCQQMRGGYTLYRSPVYHSTHTITHTISCKNSQPKGYRTYWYSTPFRTRVTADSSIASHRLRTWTLQRRRCSEAPLEQSSHHRVQQRQMPYTQSSIHGAIQVRGP